MSPCTRSRSFLTILGIIFGVGAVVAMVAIGEGARWETEQQIKLLGIENIRVKSRKPIVEGEEKQSSGRMNILSYGLLVEEFEHLLDTLPHLKTAVPLRDVRQKVRKSDQRSNATPMATTWRYTEVTNSRVIKGRFITDLDEKLHNRVAVLGANAKKELFAFRDPLNELIQIGDKWYEVIGVMEEKTAATGGMVSVRDVNKDVYLPLQTAIKDFGFYSFSSEEGSMEMVNIELDEMYFRIDEADHVESASAIIDNYLTRNHPRLDFEIVVPKELLAQQEQQQRIYDIVLVSIASISLLVGGIGIMNIMLATVTERTREIGTRRAVGAQKLDILMQFLFETVLLAISGGLIGVFIGMGGAWAITQYADMKALVTWYSVLLSFGISVMIGLVFGMYPAIKAANLSPIDALRYE
ncbi:MAG: ABC transporter permease [Planctomycetota bacterium]|nr:ABC transporter permease [Planctomycetota bacterium]